MSRPVQVWAGDGASLWRQRSPSRCDSGLCSLIRLARCGCRRRLSHEGWTVVDSATNDRGAPALAALPESLALTHERGWSDPLLGRASGRGVCAASWRDAMRRRPVIHKRLLGARVGGWYDAS